MTLEIEHLTSGDWPAVAEIYRQGIASGDATFETQVPRWEEWDAAHFDRCRFVARKGGEIVGWSALSPVSPRPVYGGVAEVSVYVAAGSCGEGVGRALLGKLVEASEEAGIWTLQGGIFPENKVSLKLHLSCGFRVVGRRERLGRHGDSWRDVILVERRSERVGAGRSR